jgi:hypothetical protein
MMIRYRGGGIGHIDTRDATDVFLTDRDHIDKQRVNVELEESNADDGMDVEYPGPDGEEDEEDHQAYAREAEDYDINIEGQPDEDSEYEEWEDEPGGDWGPEDGEDEFSGLQDLGFDEF